VVVEWLASSHPHLSPPSPSHASEGGKEGDSSKPINRWGHPMPPKVARRGRAKQEVGGLVFIDYPIMLYSL